MASSDTPTREKKETRKKWSSFKAWWSQPFSSQGSVWNWALFIGLILVLVIMWSRVIGMFEDIGESVAESVS